MLLGIHYKIRLVSTTKSCKNRIIGFEIGKINLKCEYNYNHIIKRSFSENYNYTFQDSNDFLTKIVQVKKIVQTEKNCLNLCNSNKLIYNDMLQNNVIINNLMKKIYSNNQIEFITFWNCLDIPIQRHIICEIIFQLCNENLEKLATIILFEFYNKINQKNSFLYTDVIISSYKIIWTSCVKLQNYLIPICMLSVFSKQNFPIDSKIFHDILNLINIPLNSNLSCKIDTHTHSVLLHHSFYTCLQFFSSQIWPTEYNLFIKNLKNYIKYLKIDSDILNVTNFQTNQSYVKKMDSTLTKKLTFSTRFINPIQFKTSHQEQLFSCFSKNAYSSIFLAYNHVISNLEKDLIYSHNAWIIMCSLSKQNISFPFQNLFLNVLTRVAQTGDSYLLYEFFRHLKLPSQVKLLPFLVQELLKLNLLQTLQSFIISLSSKSKTFSNFNKALTKNQVNDVSFSINIILEYLLKHNKTNKLSALWFLSRLGFQKVHLSPKIKSQICQLLPLSIVKRREKSLQNGYLKLDDLKKISKYGLYNWGIDYLKYIIFGPDWKITQSSRINIPIELISQIIEILSKSYGSFPEAKYIEAPIMGKLKNLHSIDSKLCLNLIKWFASPYSNISQAEEWFFLIPKIDSKHRLMAITILIKGYRISHQLEKAYKLVKNLRKFEITPDNFLYAEIFKLLSLKLNHQSLVSKYLSIFGNSFVVELGILKPSQLSNMEQTFVQPTCYSLSLLITSVLNKHNDPKLALDIYFRYKNLQKKLLQEMNNIDSSLTDSLLNFLSKDAKNYELLSLVLKDSFTLNKLLQPSEIVITKILKRYSALNFNKGLKVLSPILATHNHLPDSHIMELNKLPIIKA